MSFFGVWRAKDRKTVQFQKKSYLCSVNHPTPWWVSGWETGLNRKDVERNVLSAALLNLANSHSCCTVKQSQRLLVCDIHILYIDTAWARHCLFSAGRQCESLKGGISDEFDTRASFLYASLYQFYLGWRRYPPGFKVKKQTTWQKTAKRCTQLPW